VDTASEPAGGQPQGTEQVGRAGEGAGEGAGEVGGSVPAAKRRRAGEEGAGAEATVSRNVMNLGRVSGRKWKDPKVGRASSLVKGVRKVLSSEERERERAVSKAFGAQGGAERGDPGVEAGAAGAHRGEEAAQGGERAQGAVVQRITNPRTLKKMSKKQLKQLVKV